MTNVFCYKCDKSFEINTDEYYETPQEETFDVVICPHCNSPNSISWSNSVYFGANEPDDIDKRDFKDKFVEFEGEK